MRFGRFLGAAALAAIMLAAWGCSGEDSAPRSTDAGGTAPAPQETGAPPDTADETSTDESSEATPAGGDLSETLEIEPDTPIPLEAGEYEVTGFSPSLAFSLDDLAVVSGVLPTEVDFTLGPNQNVYVTFLGDSALPLRPGAKQTSADLRPDDVAATSAALVDWLRAHPRLTTSRPRPVTIGGVEGTELEIELKDGQGYRSDLCPHALECAVLFHTDPGASVAFGYVAESGRTIRVDVLDVEGRRVVILIEVDGKLETLAERADALLATVAWGASL